MTTIVEQEAATFPAPFRSALSFNIFQARYAREGAETWEKLAKLVAEDVCGGLLPVEYVKAIEEAIATMKFIPGGRYLYYAGRPVRYLSNCYIFKSMEDSRENWAELGSKAIACLMSGGGIGNDYSVYRASGQRLGRTGGVASGPIPAMEMVNEIGRRVMQGGSRRSAIYASLDRGHGDIMEFLVAKNWDEIRIPSTNRTFADAKQDDFFFHCPLDHTNISVNYSDDWLDSAPPNGLVRIGGKVGKWNDEVFLKNVEQALRNGEPGFSFNFGDKSEETGANACTEVRSADDNDVCNLGSVNMSRIDTIDEFERTVAMGTLFLLCGTIRGDLPYEKIYAVREKNRRLGLGLMGIHEWLLRRKQPYEVTPELHEWLAVYEGASDAWALQGSHTLGVSRPVACRAIAPTGTIGLLAGTTTGIEPIFAVAYKRRYLKDMRHHYQYVVDSTAKRIIEEVGTNPDNVETALSLAADPERRIRFQADIQDYVDMAISSTINLPAWGTCHNNPDRVESFAKILARYAPRLRGFTCYPDGSRGGQPITSIPYTEALKHEGQEFVEEAVDICDITGRGGSCGV